MFLIRTLCPPAEGKKENWLNSLPESTTSIRSPSWISSAEVRRCRMLSELRSWRKSRILSYIPKNPHSGNWGGIWGGVIAQSSRGTDTRVVLNVLHYSKVLGTLGDCICALTEKTDHSKTPCYSLKEQLSRELNTEKQKALYSCKTHKNQSVTVVASWWFYMFTWLLWCGGWVTDHMPPPQLPLQLITTTYSRIQTVYKRRTHPLWHYPLVWTAVLKPQFWFYVCWICHF